MAPGTPIRETTQAEKIIIGSLPAAFLAELGAAAVVEGAAVGIYLLTPRFWNFFLGIGAAASTPKGSSVLSDLPQGVEEELDQVTTSDVPATIFRTGSRTEEALTRTTGLSFRNSVSSSADQMQIFKPGDKIWAVDTRLLPSGSVTVDDNPAGHVSVFATPEQIKGAVVPSGPENFLEQLGLKPLEETGSYRLPKK